MKEGSVRLLAVVLASVEGADAAMRRRVELANEVEHLEKHYEDKILGLRAELVGKTQPLVAEDAALYKALEKFAKANRDAFFAKQKSLDLNFGVLGFRMGHWNVTYLVKSQTVVNKLEADGQGDLVTVKKFPKKQKLVEYANDVLQKWGVKKTRSERFFCELKREEVKP